AALRKKHRTAEIVWLTSEKHASLVRASFADDVCDFEPVGAIPWDWVAEEEFTHVFHPEPPSSTDELQAKYVHPMDYMAQKCGVPLESRKPWLEPGKAALLEAESFLARFGLRRKRYLTIYHTGEVRRTWPSHTLHKLAATTGLPVVVIGDAGEFATAGTVPCFGQSPRVIAALIRWSSFYIGPDSGVSWIASTTSTPMGIFSDSRKNMQSHLSFVEIFTGEKDDVIEWTSQATTESIVEHIASRIQTPSTPTDQGRPSGISLG
ncbi:MAG TPA: hypothetical protein VFO86_16475, partial [Terriglobia bacterium]|nr:hypothetical protein [Terriglobia bacterium]